MNRLTLHTIDSGMLEQIDIEIKYPKGHYRHEISKNWHKYGYSFENDHNGRASVDGLMALLRGQGIRARCLVVPSRGDTTSDRVDKRMLNRQDPIDANIVKLAGRLMNRAKPDDNPMTDIIPHSVGQAITIMSTKCTSKMDKKQLCMLNKYVADSIISITRVDIRCAALGLPSLVVYKSRVPLVCPTRVFGKMRTHTERWSISMLNEEDDIDDRPSLWLKNLGQARPEGQKTKSGAVEIAMEMYGRQVWCMVISTLIQATTPGGAR